MLKTQEIMFSNTCMIIIRAHCTFMLGYSTMCDNQF